MKNNLFLVFALGTLTFFVWAPLVFGAGLPMMYEIVPKEKADLILSRLISESLERDSSGQGKIEGSSCTTPQDFLKAIQTFHPDAGVKSVSEIPAYIRGLIFKPSPEGKYRMSRMLHCKLDLNYPRPFLEDEGAWYDPNLGVPVLAGDCSNVVGPRVDREVEAPPKPEKCPDGFSVIVHGWDIKDITQPLRRRVRKFAHLKETRPNDFKNESISRKWGGRLRELNREGNLPHTEEEFQVFASLLSDEEEESLGEFEFKEGFLKIELPNHAPEEIVRLVFVGTRFLSPARACSGYREIRIFPNEWGDWCILNTHAIMEDSRG